MSSNQQPAKKKSASRRKFLWVGLAAVILVLGGAGWFYQTGQAQKAAATPTVKMATIRTGSIRISATGTGTLTASKQVSLSFSTSGTVGQLNVQVGDLVSAGQAMAQLSELDDLKAAVSSAEIQVLQAQSSLDNLLANADLSLSKAYQAYLEDQLTYTTAQADLLRTTRARCTEEVNIKLKTAYDKAALKLADTEYGTDDWIDRKDEADTAYANMVYCEAYTADEASQAEAALKIAENELKLAGDQYDTLKQGNGVDPSELTLAQNTLIGAQNDLAVAQNNLAAGTITSPIDGTVTYVAAEQGEKVDTSTFITVSDLSQPTIEVFVDESDLDKLVIGNKAEIIFDAYPDQMFYGVVTQVDPTLTSTGQYQVVKGLVRLELSDGQSMTGMPLGLSAMVDVIQGEANNVVLVPVEALQKSADGQYTVSVMENGISRSQVVTVGLMNETYAEVTSGLEAGQLVGTSTTGS